MPLASFSAGIISAQFTDHPLLPAWPSQVPRRGSGAQDTWQVCVPAMCGSDLPEYLLLESGRSAEEMEVLPGVGLQCCCLRFIAYFVNDSFAFTCIKNVFHYFISLVILHL